MHELFLTSEHLVRISELARISGKSIDELKREAWREGMRSIELLNCSRGTLENSQSHQQKITEGIK